MENKSLEDIVNKEESISAHKNRIFFNLYSKLGLNKLNEKDAGYLEEMKNLFFSLYLKNNTNFLETFDKYKATFLNLINNHHDSAKKTSYAQESARALTFALYNCLLKNPPNKIMKGSKLFDNLSVFRENLLKLSSFLYRQNDENYPHISDEELSVLEGSSLLDIYSIGKKKEQEHLAEAKKYSQPL